ncbi:hypothetical protein M0805_008746 [Coniferiporia weirii]|nr:hypothetical protein M0805_008746 [Coniferiporia weirii]
MAALANIPAVPNAVAPNVPETNNQIWTYLTYPSSDGDTVFTLQSVATTDDDTGFGGRGGYMSVDPETNKLVQRGAPTAWKLLETATLIYKMVPFDDFLSGNSSMIASDVNSIVSSAAVNQLELLADASELTQLWEFNPTDPA